MIFKIHISQVPVIKIPTSREEYDLLFNYQTLLCCLIGHHLEVDSIVWHTNNGDLIRLGYDIHEDNKDWIVPTPESKEVIQKIRRALENQKGLPKVIYLKVLKKTLTSKIGFIHCEMI